MTFDVLIVGGGAAGLAAACKLAEVRQSVALVEARSRLGGRIYTTRDSNLNVPIELGAEFIHGASEEMMSLMDEANLDYDEITERHWHISNGKVVRSDEFWSKLEDVMDQMNDRHSDQSFEDFLQSLPPTDTSREIKEIAKLYVEGFHAASLDNIGIHGLVTANKAAAKIDGERSFRLREGYSKLVEFLQDKANKLGVSFFLNNEVRDIKWSHLSVEARTNSGLTISAKRAVITLPLSLLKSSLDSRSSTQFEPMLPGSKIEAILKLESGSALRIAMTFTRRFWEESKLSSSVDIEDMSELGFIHCPQAPLPTWWSRLPGREPILVGWSGGPNAESLLSLSEEAIADAALASLSLIFGLPKNEIRIMTVATYFHNWLADPLSGEAYSYVPVDGLKHQYALANPVDETLFFAGEATSVGHVGTVHGAIQSGYRAANEILNYLGQ